MHQPEYGTNRTYLIDTIEIPLSARLLKSKPIRQLYLEKTFSKAQLAEHFDVSESLIAKHLKAESIHGGTGKGRMTDPKNYRARIVPYGYSRKNGALVLNRREQKICKLIVELATRQNRNHSEIARELAARGLKNRAGNINWNTKAIFNIVKLWAGKI